MPFAVLCRRRAALALGTEAQRKSLMATAHVALFQATPSSALGHPIDCHVIVRVSSAIKLLSTKGNSYRKEVMGNPTRSSTKSTAKTGK